ncbi:RICIN domain-containing protein [Streptomyces uncialis]|uniref:RICIN domain-containing protein n=1 Tax=Streptomyces uncialis TaxID=1048205 RepID=UPI00386F9D46|nr:RICIN domain-containing protein [Streptomyces uncialis]
MSAALPRRLRAVCGGLALTALAAFALTAAPTAGAAAPVAALPAAPAVAPWLADPVQPVDGGLYYIRAVHSGKCLARVEGRHDRIPIEQQPCDGRTSQKIRVLGFGDFGAPEAFAFMTSEELCLSTDIWISNVPAAGSPLYGPVTARGCHGMKWFAFAYTITKGHPWAGYQIRTYQHPTTETTAIQCWHVYHADVNDYARLIHHPCNNPGIGARNDTFEFLPA